MIFMKGLNTLEVKYGPDAGAESYRSAVNLEIAQVMTAKFNQCNVKDLTTDMFQSAIALRRAGLDKRCRNGSWHRTRARMDCRSSYGCDRRGFHLRTNLQVVMKPVQRVFLNTLLIILALVLIDYFINGSLTIKDLIKIVITGVLIGLINYKLHVK